MSSAKRTPPRGSQYLFVYGTLRQAANTPMARWLRRRAQYAGPARIRGRLYQVAGYPGAVPAVRPGDWIHGDLFRLNSGDAVLAILDDYEECSERFPPPREYVRKQMPVKAQRARAARAWVYLYNHGIEGLQRIPGGDYLKARNGPASRPTG